jgi:hypothetical protein
VKVEGFGEKRVGGGGRSQYMKMGRACVVEILKEKRVEKVSANEGGRWPSIITQAEGCPNICRWGICLIEISKRGEL